MADKNIYPVITLYQPWATWIMRGWKTIETRTHNKFACLKGRRILIHASQKTDSNAVNNPYLTREQILFNPDEMINGFILGSAFVNDFRELTPNASQRALIECNTKRYGLFLDKIDRWKIPIPEKGEMGIWYYDIDATMKIKKPLLSSELQLF
jgi:hypothetical protein